MDFLSYQSIPTILRESADKVGQRTAISYKKRGTSLSLSYEELVSFLPEGRR